MAKPKPNPKAKPAPKPTTKASAAKLAKLLARLDLAEQAKSNLLAFARIMMPDPNDADDVDRSLYEAAPPHRAFADAMHKLENGTIRKLILVAPPRHGKTELCTKLFIPWWMGRNPADSVIFGTYNENFALDIGRDVRDRMLSPAFAQVFPDIRVREDSRAAGRLMVQQKVGHLGGLITFAGRNGAITGRGGSLLCIDDPIKNRAEADSPKIRDTLWNWFQSVMKTRMMTDQSRILIVQTRWHSDDIVGRLTDPTNEYYDPGEAAEWHVLELPALAGPHDPLGRKEGEPLWPSRFGKAFLDSMSRSDPRGFSALYQGMPTPPGGRFIQDTWLRTYYQDQLPSELRKYIATDFAVSLEQNRDATCLIPIGVDQKGVIWVLPDVWWQRGTSDTVVEALLKMIARHKPLAVWGEKGHISKSIGPFLRKRMQETETFAAMHEINPATDKQTRAQSIQGRLAMGKLRFPNFMPWWAAAQQEMVRFPLGAHDDFVDALSLVGLGLDTMVSAEAPAKSKIIPVGITGGMLRDAAKKQDAAKAARLGGW